MRLRVGIAMEIECAYEASLELRHGYRFKKAPTNIKFIKLLQASVVEIDFLFMQLAGVE